MLELLGDPFQDVGDGNGSYRPVTEERVKVVAQARIEMALVRQRLADLAGQPPPFPVVAECQPPLSLVDPGFLGEAGTGLDVPCLCVGLPFEEAFPGLPGRVLVSAAPPLAATMPLGLHALPVGAALAQVPEVINGHVTPPGLPATTRQVGVLVYGGLFLPEFNHQWVPTLREKALAGAQVELLFGDPEGKHITERGDDEGIGHAMSSKILNALAFYNAETAVRETREETGVEIEVTGVVGIYTNPNHAVEYSDGEVRQQFSICFQGRYVAGEPAPSDESSEVRWMGRSELGDLPIHPSMRLRIEHGFEQRVEPYIG
ncbi:NUDIX hydrolase [Micromonospora sp. NPDC048063]|uniref:NUDIX hydrolase n=1 Tax=Micromonospora sp. NPDC048063 TaxID=3364256 RepID=UPI00371ABF6A